MANYKSSITAEFFKDLRRLPSAIYPRAMDTLIRMTEDPWATELHPEKIQSAESGVHSSRIDQAYRVIWKHIKPDHIVFCLADKHDEAYRRARRKSFTLDAGVIRVADIVDVGVHVPETPAGFLQVFGRRDNRPGKCLSRTPIANCSHWAFRKTCWHMSGCSTTSINSPILNACLPGTCLTSYS